MNYKINLRKKTILMVVVSVLFGSCFYGRAFADIVIGDGATSQGGVEYHGCDDAKTYQNVQHCPTSNGKFGGASWHVFSTSKPPVTQTGVPSYDDRPINRPASIGNGYPGNKGKVEDICKETEYEYYFAYVYDGWYGYRQWSTKSLVFYGPLDWGTYKQTNDEGVVHRPIYHNHGKNVDHTWAEIEDGLEAGTNMNKWRIRGEHPTNGYGNNDTSYKSAEALKAWRAWSGDSNATKIPDKTGFFCVKPSKVTLTAYARELPAKSDGTYKALNNGNAISSDTVRKGHSASVTSADFNPSGYTWFKWGSKGVCKDAGSNRPCSATIDEDKNVYAYYEKNTYAGRSRAAGATGSWSDIATTNRSDTDWHSSGTNNKTIFSIENCSPVDGCTGSLRHLIKRTYGEGTTKYRITRTSNYSTVQGGVIVGETTEDFTGEGVNTDSNGRKYRTVSVNGFVGKLFPGMMVCETLEFMPDNLGSHVGDASTTACLSAEGKAQPDDPPDNDTVPPSDDTSYFNIKVKNNDVTRYNSYQKTVYAKPGDKLNYWATYNPVLQYTYDLIPETVRIKEGSNYGTTYPTSGKNTSRYLGKTNTAENLKSMFNKYKPDSFGTWKNRITVYSQNFATPFSENYLYDNGSTAKQNEKNDYAVSPNEAGRKLDELVNTNVNATTQTTPRQITFALHDDLNRASVQTEATAKKATAVVPYNYISTTKITTKPGEVLIYAGESFSFNYDFNINPKSNALTTNSSYEKYATTIGNPKWKLQMRVNGGGWTDTPEYSGDQDFSVPLNKMSVGRVDEGAIKLATKINIPDVSAGSSLCVRSVVWPERSGADDSVDKDGNKQWAYSPEVCFTVVKKPSLQVWGGNIYTNGEVTTAVSDKNNLSGYADVPYNITGNEATHRVFGSWAELGIIASGPVKGFASGASTGYKSNTNGVLSPSPIANSGTIDPGGSTLSSFCDRSVLTLSNDCSNIGSIGNTVGVDGSKSDKNAIVERLVGSKENDYSGNVDLGLVGNYAYGRENINVSCAPKCVIGNGTKMVHSDKTIKIGSNIEYVGSYNRLSVMPKVVIYGKNIEIGCGVTRIDAVLLADETVVTCDNLGSDGSYYERSKQNINQRPNSTQLKVNGAIVAGKLVANRTYGAASGPNSIVPAEIINFDPSLYLWGGGENSEDDEELVDIGDYQSAYLHELAPRK